MIYWKAVEEILISVCFKYISLDFVVLQSYTKTEKREMKKTN